MQRKNVLRRLKATMSDVATSKLACINYFSFSDKATTNLSASLSLFSRLITLELAYFFAINKPLATPKKRQIKAKAKADIRSI